jgi:hypothetical protein
VYYTSPTPSPHNRISRFTANGNVAVPGSEVVLLEIDALGPTNHNGGALNFGTDGALYASTGENATGANAQSLDNLLGKILRINPDGSIPADNPFYNSAVGNARAIWALGLRNPFTFAFSRSGAMMINDVGEATWEEIDRGVAGANYGWPYTEGPTADPSFLSPVYAYAHDGSACAIVGGAYYTPLTVQFPQEYNGSYFFADYCAGWIKKLDQAGTVTTFATGISLPVAVRVGDDGALYYLARGTGDSSGSVYRITSNEHPVSNDPPTITAGPQSQIVLAGTSVTLAATATGPGPIRYQWQMWGWDIPGATSSVYQTSALSQDDDAAFFNVRVSNDAGSVVSAPAVVTVMPSGPTGPLTITANPQSQVAVAGTSITLSVTATGSGPLSYQWQMWGWDIPGATSPVYQTNALTTNDDGAVFRVLVSNGTDAIYSAPAVVKVP